MSRTQLPLIINDVSALSRSLRRQLEDAGQVPGHVEMMNLLAKAGGYKNFQHLKAEQAKPQKQQPLSIDMKRVTKATRYFDLNSQLRCWPKKYNQRILCLWVLWSRLPARTAMTELELDEKLILAHSFCDHAMLRRWLVDEELVSRTPDGREYKRIEARPPLEAVELIRQVNQ
ncbi:DUF2087 domain-containing protein [Desulfovibrio sp. JC010]|uniref:DUF2087 domain-containing protein n=1 Tax=Desulfovibrio sp. JC010 TaxID=2593641 RepID=UPI0013D54F0F|nr:DUF2087 domain-containing protein [Desulfovibrio sp. JC010]NDV27416.1 DUF2087 domain-containing protein [Desulfovibrio sp. JC010]